jgi:hypothetical protein
MAKAARGLPEGFSLDLPDEKPVMIGDFLDEEPPAFLTQRPQKPAVPERAERVPVQEFRPEIVRDRAEDLTEKPLAKPVPRSLKQPTIIRYQLNLTPKAKTMLEEFMEHVQTYSPQSDAKVSEVFQGIMTLLHNAKDELELAELPQRGAWGSVTAKNFPGALSEAFEGAILRAAQKRGGL